MPELRCLAISAGDPPRLARFYSDVFNLGTVDSSDFSTVLSDGSFNLVLLKNRSMEPRGLCLLGFHVESPRSVKGKLPTGEGLISRPSHGIPRAEFRLGDPDGNLIDVAARALETPQRKSPFPIRHIAIYTPNPQRLADFYGVVFEMRAVSRTDRSSIFVSDGTFNLALLFQREEEKLGLHHFGFHVKSNEEMRERIELAGGSAGDRRPGRIPYAEYRVYDPEGNGFDISEKGWEV